MIWRPPKDPPSPHFSWAEVIGHGRSGYSRVPLGPTPIGLGRMVMTPRRNAIRHAGSLEALRWLVNEERRKHALPPTGINLLSWARSFGHNRAVGGASSSQHLYFLGTDISVQEIDRLMPWEGGRHDFDHALEMVFRFGGVGLYPAGNRHCDTRGHRARWTVA